MNHAKVQKTISSVIAILLVIVMTLSPAMSSWAEEPAEAAYVTREYAVSEFVQSVGRNNLQGSTLVLGLFNDADQITPEYREDMARAITNGMVSGSPDRMLEPEEAMTRAETLVLMYRTLCLPAGDSDTGALAETDDALIEEAKEVLPSDTPEWALDALASLIAAEIVDYAVITGKPLTDLITPDEFEQLISISDTWFNTCSVGDSFYGYVNDKTLRNAPLSTRTTLDARHGAIVQQLNGWSYDNEITKEISDQEISFVYALMEGIAPYEEGTAEQRVHDYLLCMREKAYISDSDRESVVSWREAILNAETVQELIDVSAQIARLTGINPLFDIDANADPETNYMVPTVTFFQDDNLGLINFRSITRELLEERYKKVLMDYAEAASLPFSEEDVDRYLELGKRIHSDTNYYSNVLMGFSFLLKYGMDLDIDKEREIMLEEHPELDEYGAYIEDPAVYLSPEEADRFAPAAEPTELLNAMGFYDYDKIGFLHGNVMADADSILTEDNLNALKLGALINFVRQLNAYLDSEEEWYSAMDSLGNTASMTVSTMTDEDVDGNLSESAEGEETEGYDLIENAEEEADQPESEEAPDAIEPESEEIDPTEQISDEISIVNGDLPNDVGIIYATRIQDPEIYGDVGDMVEQIGQAYVERFQKNEWMSEETKREAIKKVENIIAVIGYRDLEEVPEIRSPEEGGTTYSNSISASENRLAMKIRVCADREFIRTLMLESPDVMNAFYIPSRNSINIQAGILNAPYYSTEASRAENLGAIGQIIGHEIGHAFDVEGSRYNETGLLADWWTPEDREAYQELVQRFEDYYEKFEVVSGVVQDSSITIGENMADFAGLRIVLDILEGDPEAQREALISYAHAWAQAGTTEYLTQNLDDVHSSNNVRIDATVASMDEFYELFDISEDDPMYVAPEDRLRLW